MKSMEVQAPMSSHPISNRTCGFPAYYTPQLQLGAQGGHYETFYQDHAYVVDWFLYGFTCKCRIGL